MDKAKQEAEVEPLNNRVDAFLAREHERLDHILQDVEYLSEHGSFHLAAKRFAEFRRGIEEHTAAEERMLLPIFVEKTGDPGGISEQIHTER